MQTHTASVRENSEILTEFGSGGHRWDQALGGDRMHIHADLVSVNDESLTELGAPVSPAGIRAWKAAECESVRN